MCVNSLHTVIKAIAFYITREGLEERKATRLLRPPVNAQKRTVTGMDCEFGLCVAAFGVQGPQMPAMAGLF